MKAAQGHCFAADKFGPVAESVELVGRGCGCGGTGNPAVEDATRSFDSVFRQRSAGE